MVSWYVLKGCVLSSLPASDQGNCFGFNLKVLFCRGDGGHKFDNDVIFRSINAS